MAACWCVQVLGDFPDVEKFQERLSAFDDWGRSFKKLDQRMIDKVEEVMSVQIPKLMRQLPALHREQRKEEEANENAAANPFGDHIDFSGTDGGVQWAVSGAQKSHWDNVFGDLPVRAHNPCSNPQQCVQLYRTFRVVLTDLLRWCVVCIVFVL